MFLGSKLTYCTVQVFLNVHYPGYHYRLLNQLNASATYTTVKSEVTTNCFGILKALLYQVLTLAEL
jgi:hypothetical protein